MDSSPDMIEKAQAAAPPGVQFILGDLNTYSPPADVDVYFSNAVFHWIPYDERLPIMKRLLQTLPSGGVFAFQVPDNYNEPSHSIMRLVAAEKNKPWSETFAGLEKKPELDPFQSPQELYDELGPMCERVDIWHTYYQHAMDGGHEGIVEWVKGTGLRPFIDPLKEGGEREGYLKRYLEALREGYRTQYDGKVLLRYPRLFVVAVKA